MLLVSKLKNSLFVLVTIHLVKYLGHECLFDDPLFDGLDICLHLRLRLPPVFVPMNESNNLLYCCFDLVLYNLEVLLRLITENPLEQSNVIVLTSVVHHAVKHALDVLYHQLFQAVLLIEVKVQVLLHVLLGVLLELALPIILHLLNEDIIDQVNQLSQRNDLNGYLG